MDAWTHAAGGAWRPPSTLPSSLPTWEVAPRHLPRQQPVNVQPCAAAVARCAARARTGGAGLRGEGDHVPLAVCDVDGAEGMRGHGAGGAWGGSVGARIEPDHIALAGEAGLVSALGTVPATWGFGRCHLAAPGRCQGLTLLAHRDVSSTQHVASTCTFAKASPGWHHARSSQVAVHAAVLGSGVCLLDESASCVARHSPSYTNPVFVYAARTHPYMGCPRLLSATLPSLSRYVSAVPSLPSLTIVRTMPYRLVAGEGRYMATCARRHRLPNISSVAEQVRP